ncbi:MAG: hypothetical protein MUQ30_10500, partial [Anaerolineae bacterium]|nr:hypothetical protein [Anaerolineae bacterium]
MVIYETLPVPLRIRRLREALFATETQWCFERARLVTGSYTETVGQHSALRRARARAKVFDEMPILIRPDELIVGQRASVLGGRAVYPEYHLDGLTEEIVPEEVWEYWHDNTIGDITRRAQPARLRVAEREQAAGFVTGSNSGFGHVIVDYEKVLRYGFRSIADEATV